MSLTNKRIYSFGEFQLRVGARLLVRDGKPVPLGSKAFEVLTCLVMHAGEVVTKDQLLRTVWPESFVEEGNLPQHIFALRRALGDRASFIVTVPGRGYQFTEVVLEVAELPPAGPAENGPAETGSFLLQRTKERTHIVIEETAIASSGDLPHDAQKAAPATLEGICVSPPDASALVSSAQSSMAVEHRREDRLALPSPPPQRRFLTLTLAVLVFAALLGGWFAWHRSGLKAPASQRVVLADLDNRTGDAGFNVVLKNALEIDLDQSPYMNVMSEPEELNTLRLMGRKPDTSLDPMVAREVCRRSNRQVLITGTIASVGQTYLLTLEAADCDSGEILAGAKAVAATKEHTLEALDTAAAKLRQGLGESAESLQRFQVPIAQATTSSLEALEQYSLGEYLLGRMGKQEDEVLPLFQRALELDRQFAMASAAIATGYYSLGEYELAEPYYQKAFDLSGQVSEKERLYIRAHYYADDKRDAIHGIEAYRQWAEVYPGDWGPWLDIANEYSQVGQYSLAIVAGERALTLDPNRGIVYSELARDYMHAGRYADAKSTAARAVSIGRDSMPLHATLFETALLENNRAAMDSEIAQSEGKDDQWRFLNLQALVAAKNGSYKHAEELFHAAFNAAMTQQLPQKADDILIDEASASFDCGMTNAARATLHRIRAYNPSDPATELLHAELGDITPAARSIAAHSGPDSSDTLLTYVYGPRLRAQIALDQAKPQQAIAELQTAAPYDFAAGFATIAERGQAYLMANEPEQAATEYQKIVDHPGVDPASPLIPLAYLGLARAESKAGLVEQSRATYEKLFEQWKEADPDLPVLLIARREYASLGAAHR
jgi:eukaryotic-like serine/threonine-protein kinase